LTFPLLGDEYQGGARPPRISWSELCSKTFGIDVEACSRCRYTPMRVMAVVTPGVRFEVDESLKVCASRKESCRRRPVSSSKPYATREPSSPRSRCGRERRRRVSDRHADVR